MKIAAVVVTFNRKDMLLETLRGLRQQTRKLDRIYLINNASTDGTEELLRSENILDWDNLDYCPLDKNTGGAGGFATGMQLAYDAGYDWIWTMDDDIEPDQNALQELLKYSDISQCMNSTKIFTQNNETQYWEQYFDFATARLIDLKNASFHNGRDWCTVNVACFEGMLVHRNIIDKIGLPEADYFIYHDDTVFGIKASF
ncbi:MAG: glycosyl transferase, family 2, partial [Gammaproteobacteria bacterium]